MPVAATENVAVCPTVMDWLDGCVVIAGALFTVSVKLCVALVPTPFCAVIVIG